MATKDLIEYTLPRQAYATFDAVSMRQMIIDRLRQNNVFSDIQFEGSNISGLTDIFAFVYHVLLFYLNNTASEALFNQATLYENMNKIVSLIQYKPTGRQTALVNFTFTASQNLPADFYTIGRFAYLYTNGIPYSFNKDIFFEKSTNLTEQITSVSDNNVLYQGIFREYPLYTAIGDAFEQITLAVDGGEIDASTFIDTNNIYVFVKSADTGTWSEWLEVQTLFLNNGEAKVFEKRVNEFGRHEIKFGNNVTGKGLKTGDLVAIYYLESAGEKGVIGAKQLNNAKLVLYNTTQYREIFGQINNTDVNYVNANEIQTISLTNTYGSTNPTDLESVDEIRQNAPLVFASQNRAVTKNDFKVFVDKNFSNIVSNVYIANNDEQSDYLQYFYDIGLSKPNEDSNVMYQQVTFSSACNFNNVYVYAVPAFGAIVNETTPNNLALALKQLIVNAFNGIKMETQNIVVCDPVYLAFDLGVQLENEVLTTDVRDDTYLLVTRDSNSTLSKEQIKTLINNEIVEFFSQSNNELGQLLDITQLTTNLYNIAGIKDIQTVRGSKKVQKLSFVAWNPTYPTTDIDIITQNTQLDFFKFPFFYEVSKLKDKIVVQ